MSFWERRQHALALIVGLVLVSTSVPFLLVAHVPTAVVVFWRALMASAFLLLFSRQVENRHRKTVVLGGVLMATHWLLWVGAFHFTTFASNVLLLVAQPICGAIIDLTIGKPVSKFVYVGMVFALVGLGIIAEGDLSGGPLALLGDAMCILAGAVIALYYVVTQRARNETPLPAFVGWTFLVASICTLPIIFISKTPLVSYPKESWGYIVALAFLTTVGGHGLMNLAAKKVPLIAVNMVIVAEPAIAIALGAIMFGAGITSRQIVGGFLLGLAVVIALAGDRLRVFFESRGVRS